METVLFPHDLQSDSFSDLVLFFILIHFLIFLFEHSNPRATEVLSLFVRGSSAILKLVLVVVCQGVEQRVRFLGVDIESIGEIGGHSISPLLAESPEPLYQSFPVLRV